MKKVNTENVRKRPVCSNFGPCRFSPHRKLAALSGDRSQRQPQRPSMYWRGATATPSVRVLPRQYSTGSVAGSVPSALPGSDCVRREQLYNMGQSQTFDNGYTVGDKVYYTGTGETFDNGDWLEHGTQGEVVGPATRRRHRGKGVAVLFPGNKRAVECYLTQARRLPPPTTALRVALADPLPKTQNNYVACGRTGEPRAATAAAGRLSAAATSPVAPRIAAPNFFIRNICVVISHCRCFGAQACRVFPDFFYHTDSHKKHCC